MSQNTTKINWRTILLGLVLNILVIVVFIFLYHAYVIRPRIDTSIHIPDMSAYEENTEMEMTP